MADQLPWGTQVGISCTKFIWKTTYKSIQIPETSWNIPETSSKCQVRFLVGKIFKILKQQKTSKGDDIHITQVVIYSHVGHVCWIGFLPNFWSSLTASTGEQRVPMAVGSFLVESWGKFHEIPKWNFKKFRETSGKHQNVYTPPASSPNEALKIPGCSGGGWAA